MALADMVRQLGQGVSKVKDLVTGNKTPPSATDGMPDEEKYPERPSDPAIDISKAEQWANTLFQRLRTAYVIYHQNIWQNILFYVGQTWLTLDRQRGYYTIAEPEDEYTPMPRINRFAPAIDAICSNFNTIPPIEAVARDAEGDELYKRHGIAEIANRLAQDFIIRTGLKSDFKSQDGKASEAAMDFVLSGSLLTYVQACDLPSVESEALGSITQKTVECDLLPAMCALPRPGSKQLGGLSGSPYLAIARRMTLQEIYQRFQVNAHADNEYLDGYNSQYKSSLQFWYVGFNTSASEYDDSALVTEYLVPPASADNSGLRDFAETGLYGVYVNGSMKYVESYAFPCHPITKIDYIRVPTLFFGRTPAFDLCPLQIEAQEYDALIKLHGMSNASTPWVVDKNTLVGEITGRGDRIIAYRSIGPNSPAPKREQAGALDAGVYERVKYIDSQFQNISGAASVFRGRQEGSVTAGTAIAQLRGQAEQMFAGPSLNWNNGWKETVRKAVIFMQKCYTLPQIMAIVGSAMVDPINDFLSCDLDACLEWLAAAHGLPRTQDELRQEMIELFDKKALDINDPNVKERMFTLFGETGMLTMFNLDATRARMENKMMKQGVHPIFRPAIEDLAVHYAIHTEAVKSLSFDRLPPVAQETFLAHIMETKAAMVPPAPIPPPSTLSFAAKLEDLPAPLTDAVLEQHGLHPAPAVAPPPPHHIGKPVPPGTEPPPAVGPHRGTVTRGGEEPRTAHDPGALASQGKPTGSPVIPHGQGVQPIGASRGAPPSPPIV